mmetsp:Transcript_29951/g.96646  ORF Transcript_29951/g.96646 Transcript_29951/m.96646 type:complete len:290 (-) Transcript_29951:20-889(-)
MAGELEEGGRVDQLSPQPDSQVSAVIPEDVQFKGVSYGFLLSPAATDAGLFPGQTGRAQYSGEGLRRPPRGVRPGGFAAGPPRYDPLFLDDPTLQFGKARMVMNLPGFVESVVPYVKPRALKAQLNEQWALKHQWVSRGLTLSKLRASKQSMLEWVAALDGELATAALAHVYLEKLVLRRVVHKPNRKLMAAVCLLLAAKWNEPELLPGLLESVEKNYSIPRATLFRSEWSTYVELGFDISAEPHELYPHFTRLLQASERTPHEYLGESHFQDYVALFLQPHAEDEREL